jgi:hypothetical protein
MADTTIKPGTAVVGRRGWHHHRDPARRAAGVCAIYLHADSGHLRATVFRDGRDEVDFDNVDAIVGSPAASAFAETKESSTTPAYCCGRGRGTAGLPAAVQRAR